MVDVRLGLVLTNPCKGVPKYRETAGRITFIGPEEEGAILGALSGRLKDAFLISLNTGMRWSEQHRLVWRDIDILSERHRRTGGRRASR